MKRFVEGVARDQTSFLPECLEDYFGEDDPVGVFDAFVDALDLRGFRRYWTSACLDCAIKDRCTTGRERRITRWEHEHLVDADQNRLDTNPEATRRRRETVEHPFGTIKARMGATHFLMKRLKNVRTEMALHVLAYNLTRAITILDTGPLIRAIRA
jgi:hypothetical protein